MGIPNVKDIKGALPYDQRRDHATARVQDGGTVITSGARANIAAHVSDPAAVAEALREHSTDFHHFAPSKGTQGVPPIHPSMQPGHRGHAVSKSQAPAQPLNDVQGPLATKAIPVAPVNPGCVGSLLSRDPDYTPAKYQPDSNGNLVLAEAAGSRHLPAATHPSDTAYARKP
jgi:hypothetical protein